LYSGNSKGLFGVGVLDFAGSGVVHMVGGFSSLVAAKIVGYRNQYVSDEEQSQKGMKPRFAYAEDGTFIVNELPSSNPVIATLGVFVLWFGWYGFNCGSVVKIVGQHGTTSR
jgi:Amt family ammonium transporter